MDIEVQEGCGWLVTQSPNLKFLASYGELHSEGEIWETLSKNICELRRLGTVDPTQVYKQQDV